MSEIRRGDKVTVQVDGRDVAVAAGTNVLEAILSVGGAISYFCYHPGLSVVAVCRQCLVGIDGAPKLVPACQAVVKDGMAVDNSSERVREARRAMLEFTLLQHPIDCPICDKAGECQLQKHYMNWDHAPARGADFPKLRKPKVVDVGPRIVLDAERCILCTRCIRVCDEVAGEHELDMAWRGARQTLATAPGRRLENAYSLNTVDVCPVGALTDKDFRFQRRVWDLSATPSVCAGCATGCNDEIHHADGRVYRLYPRKNLEVNRWWMCDDGRDTYREIRRDRVGRACVDGREAAFEDALARAAAAVEAARPHVGVVLSARATNEDNFLAAKIAFDYLALPHVYLAGRAPWRSDDVLRDADRNPNRRGAQAVARGRTRDAAALGDDVRAGKVRALYVLDSDLALDADVETLVVAAWQESPLTRRATVVLPAAAWAEVDGTVTNRQGLVQRLRCAVPPPGEATPHHMILARLGRRLGLAIEPRPARAVFDEMRAAVPAFKDADFGRDAPPLLLRFAGSRG